MSDSGPEKRPPWRPTKLTPEVHARVVTLIRAGNFLETAAAAAGVSVSTLRDWMRRGAREAADGEETVYSRFFADADVAQGEAEAREVARVQLAGKQDWRASAWWLEHRFPERWGQRQRLEHSGPGGAPVALDVTSPAFQAALYRVRSRRAEDGEARDSEPGESPEGAEE